jgi:hypothetical protein
VPTTTSFSATTENTNFLRSFLSVKEWLEAYRANYHVESIDFETHHAL